MANAYPTCLFFLAFVTGLNAQEVATPPITSKWKITHHETFGVKEKAGNEQQTDHLWFNTDHSVSLVENGKEWKGNWVFYEKTKKFVRCVSNNPKDNRIFRIIQLDTLNAIFEYQTPDLIRTKWYCVKE